jgi:hypothetical protein
MGSNVPAEGVEVAAVPEHWTEPKRSMSSAPPLRVLSKEDRLEAENIQLRIQVQVGLVEKAEQLYVQRSQGLNALLEARKLLQSTLADRYGIDFTKEQIEPETGRIIQAGQAAVIPPPDSVEK